MTSCGQWQPTPIRRISRSWPLQVEQAIELVLGAGQLGGGGGAAFDHAGDAVAFGAGQVQLAGRAGQLDLRALQRLADQLDAEQNVAGPDGLPMTDGDVRDDTAGPGMDTDVSLTRAINDHPGDDHRPPVLLRREGR